jgi:glycosyltransferase involved in cell wall biosynthesis
MSCDLTILLPAYNEEAAIGLLLDEIRSEVKIPHKVLVIDNNSNDKTMDIALEKGAVVVFERTPGKGNAIRCGITKIDTDYTIMMNSDLTYPPQHVEAIRELLIRGNDVVIGSRTLLEKGAMSHLHAIGNWYLSALASVLYGKRIIDLCTGMWGFKTEVLKSLPIDSNHFTLEADILINVIGDGYQFTQIPIGYRSRVNGDKSKLRLSDGLAISNFLIKKRMRWQKYGK